MLISFFFLNFAEKKDNRFKMNNLYNCIKGYNRLIIIGLIIIMGIGFYLICASNPLRWDDLMYQYMWLDHKEAYLLHPVDLNNRVDNFQEVFASQCNHYKVMNGRFIVHYITQCFCGFIGKGIFNYINATVYVLFLIVGILFTKAFTLRRSVFVIAGLWLLPPVQWILSFDVVFPINYLWSATMCITFLVLFHHEEKSNISPSWIDIPLFLFGVICGNFHEGYTLLLSGALFFYALFNFKKLNIHAWCMILGMWLGTLTVIGSPGIWDRAAGASTDSFQEALLRKIDILRYSKRLYLLIAILVISSIYWDKNKLKGYIRENQIELMIVALGFVFLFMLPYYSQRMGFPMELFAVLLTLKLLLQYNVKKVFANIATVIIPVLLIVHLAYTVKYAKIVGKEYCDMIAEYQQSQEGVAHFHSFEVPKLIQPYICRLDVPFEQGLISFTMKKEMVIEQDKIQ